MFPARLLSWPAHLLAALVLVFAAWAAPAHARTSCPVQPSWQPGACRSVTFADGFNGTSVNHSKWETVWLGGTRAHGYSGPFNPGYETACYYSGNVSESGGFVNLALTHQASHCRGRPEPWTGAVLDSLPTFHQLYGAFEARVCLPGNGAGRIVAWPAWWQVGYRGNWPAGGEIDTIEGLNDQYAGQAAAHLHYTGAGDNGPGRDSPKTYGAGCHRFGEVWSPAHEVAFYWDGTLVWQHPFPAVTPQALLFDLTLAPDSVQPPGTVVMRVDWVRVWR